MSEFIGVVRSMQSGTILAVINPDSDDELDDPRWLLIRGLKEPISLVLVPREEYMNARSMAEIERIVERIVWA
jgi:hypothetical protein